MHLKIKVNNIVSYRFLKLKHEHARPVSSNHATKIEFTFNEVNNKSLKSAFTVMQSFAKHCCGKLNIQMNNYI